DEGRGADGLGKPLGNLGASTQGVRRRQATGYHRAGMVDRVEVNGREYRLPRQPTVAITVDGCEPAYLDDALGRGRMPRLRSMLQAGGTYCLGRAHMPTLTNPNNLSIVTGAPPSVHGIPGNHCLLDGRAEAVQLVEPEFLRAPTIHAVMRRAGV